MAYTTFAPAHPKLAAAIAVCGVPKYVIAARARVHVNTLGGILSGRVRPSASARARIAEALGLPADELFVEQP